MFEAAYDSPWHHPGAAWASAALVLLLAARRPRSPAAGLAALLAVVSALDAWCSGPVAPPAAPGSAGATALAVAFVIAGDLRFFYVLARARRDRASAAAVALGLALVVPAASFAAQRAWPTLLPGPRALFLAYEGMFVAVAAAALAWTQRHVRGDDARWLSGLCAFELVQYAGWAAADVVILAGHDVGYLLRIPPNLMYYAAFVPFLWATAPAAARA